MFGTEILRTAIDPVITGNGRCVDGAGSLVDIFFSEEIHEIARAKAICAMCTVRERCLVGAELRREPWGVWGGELFMNGKVLSAKRRRGRPPKHARPELVVDELGHLIVATA
jgi:Transcription factor WhiB